jgi:hypothetical protein
MTVIQIYWVQLKGSLNGAWPGWLMAVAISSRKIRILKEKVMCDEVPFKIEWGRFKVCGKLHIIVTTCSATFNKGGLLNEKQQIRLGQMLYEMMVNDRIKARFKTEESVGVAELAKEEKKWQTDELWVLFYETD